MEGYVEIPIPVKFVPDVYALLAKLSGQGETPAPASTERTNGVPEEWSKSDLVRMWRESPPSMREFTCYLADRPEQMISSTEIGEAINRPGLKLAGALGAFGRRVANRYSKETWPFLAVWDHEHERMGYQMSSGTADIIKEVAGS